MKNAILILFSNCLITIHILLKSTALVIYDFG